MLQAETKNIDGVDFQFLPIPAMRALRLDKQVVGIVAPILGSLGSINPQAEVSLDSIGEGISRALGDLTDSTFIALVRDTLAFVTWIGPSGAVLLDKDSAIDQMVGTTGVGPVIVYKLLIEAWRFNKLTPFALAGTFGLQPTTGISPSEMPGRKPGGLKLAR